MRSKAEPWSELKLEESAVFHHRLFAYDLKITGLSRFPLDVLRTIIVHMYLRILFVFNPVLWSVVGCCGPATLAQDILAEAHSGVPFGYAQVVIPLDEADTKVLRQKQFSVSDAEHRTLYSVFSTGSIRRLLEEVLNTDSSENARQVNALFLFTGDAPLTVTIHTSREHVVRIVPQRGRPLKALRVKQMWWREFSALERLQSNASDYPPLVETYLNTMLARRLQLQPTLMASMRQEKQNVIFEAAELLGGSENQRLVAMRDMFHAPPETDATIETLPEPIRWLPPGDLPVDPKVQIEDIAHRVPRECFYVRFGSWDNQVWLSYLLREYGGDLGRMLTLRGTDDQSSDRFEKQLVLFKNKFADMFGGQIIEDLAFIGRDFYMREGGSIGVIIQAKSKLLTSQLSGERKRVQKKFADQRATLEDVEIGGKKVSFLSTPDNSIRSFFASDGKFHLITNSRQLVERFLAVPTDRTALADEIEFRHIRSEMPLDREDTVFVFIPSDFLHGLLSPQYQIENRRRVRAATKIEMLQLARLAARNEMRRELTLDELIAAGFLPPRFQTRFDGVPARDDKTANDGETWSDLQRGGRRNFLPIADVPVITTTRGETDFYNSRAAYVRERIPRMDPIAVAMRRYGLNDDGLERLVVDAVMSPMQAEKYGWLLSMLGPPMDLQVQPTRDEIISVRASVDGGLVFADVPPHQWFLGIQNEVPPMTQIRRAGFFELIEIARTTPGYIGAWPKPGLLDRFPTRLSRDVNRDGFSRSMVGLHRMQAGDFSVLSFDKQRLEAIRPELDMLRTAEPAQITFNVEDLTQSNLKTWVSTLTYQRALQSSQGNPRLLHTINQQLGVPAADCRDVAQLLLDAKLVCPLGGEYQLKRTDSGIEYWASDKLPPNGQLHVPEDYDTPLLKWFRGTNGSLLVDGGRLKARLYLDIQRAESEPKVKLPSFNFFGGSDSGTSGGKKKE